MILVMKLLPVPLISILSMTFGSLARLIPSSFIFVAVRLSVFLHFDLIVFCKRFEYSSLLRRYIFDVWSAAVKVLFDYRTPFISLASVLWNLLSTYYLPFKSFFKWHWHYVIPFYCIVPLRYSVIISRLKIIARVKWNSEYLQP